MKKIIIFFLFSALAVQAYAQLNADSLAYQAQRKKINAMLAQRKKKFGQYDQSLSQHTGIFGMQTKKDIRRSNDILMDIVNTDNSILLQTKILLDYRTFQQSEVQSRSDEIDNANLDFMNAINKLRAENDTLRKQVADMQRRQQKTSQISLGIVFGLLVVVLLLLRAKYRKKHR